MAYVNPNYKTKKDLKEGLAKGVAIQVFSPGLETIPTNGIVYLEGPHSPEPHMWYGEATMKNGKLVKVR